MAARIKAHHQEDIKTKIQGVQLTKLLQDHALTGEYNGKEVSQSRIDAAKFLLNKIIANPPAENNTNISGSLSFGWLT